MADTNHGGTQVNIGSIVIKGAPAGTSAARLDQAIRLGLGQALSGSDRASGGEPPRNIPRLRLQLPPGATEADIAQALAHAIARTRQGDQP